MTLHRHHLPAIMLALIFGAVAGCEEPGEPAVVSPEILALDADFIVFGGEQYISRAGITEAHLVYDTAFQWIDSSAVALRRLVLVVFNEDGTERARVTADRGTLDQRTDQMVARGSPGNPARLVVPGEGRTLESQEIHYDPEGGRIRSDSSFVMRTPTQVLRGRSFTSDLDFRDFRAVGDG
jgi:LPS export ABC transporter protein LptC